MAHIHVENETGLFLTGKRIFPEKSLMLYDRPIDSHTLEDFEVASGEWEASNDGWLTGQIRKNGGGILYSRQSYPRRHSIGIRRDGQYRPVTTI